MFSHLLNKQKQQISYSAPAATHMTDRIERMQSLFIVKRQQWFPILLLGCAIICLFRVQVLLAQNNTTASQPTSPQSYFGGVDHDAYIAWYESIQSKYTGNAFLSRTEPTKKPTTTENSTTSTFSSIPDTVLKIFSNSSTDVDGVAVHWYLDDLYLYIGVASRAQNGWVAFGLAEAGGMKGSDIVIYETSKPNLLTDAHVLDKKVTPTSDICQDWTLLNSVNDGGFLIFEGKRLLDTMDGQDHRIINDTESFIPAQRIIAAWDNETDTMQYHGENRVRGAVRFYDTIDEAAKFKLLTETEADGSFLLLVNNHTIENITTAYVEFCFNWDTDIVPQGVPPNTNIYVVAAETVLDEEGGSFVHHASMSASTEPKFNESRGCLEYSKYNFFLYSWTPGTFPLVFPSDVGITMGPNDDAIRSFKFQVHYDNPKLLNGVRDSSGLRIYFKYAAPKYEAGIMPLGDILTSMEGTPLSSGTTRFDFACSEQCSSLVLGNEPVTVIGEFFHMHNRGASAVQYQIRNGEVIRKANVNFFDFDQAGVYAVRQQPYQIFPGDAFRTSFFFQSDDDSIFGPASADEMCNSVLLYYPRKSLLGEALWSCVYDIPLVACSATLTSYAVETDGAVDSTADDGGTLSTGDAMLERTFGYNTGNQCFDKNLTDEGSGTNDSQKSSSSNPKQFFLLYPRTCIIIASLVTFLDF